MPPGFSEEQEALIEKIAWSVGDAISERIRTERAQDIRLHFAECAHGKAISRAKWVFVGALILGPLLGGGGGALLARILMAM